MKDTSLLILYTRPFFYNLVKGNDGLVYAGTSEGIFRMDGAEFVKLDDRMGYLTLDEKGRLRIDPNGIKYHEEKSFVRLLPFPDKARETYHAGTEDHFYIVSGGRMHVYEILPYGIRYPNHSVRTASPNFVGTYSGVYYRGVRLTGGFPGYCDGHIREYNGKAFLCFNYLGIADLHGGDTLPDLASSLPPGFDFNYTSDILYSTNHNRYFVATRHQLGTIDRELTKARPVYTRNEKHGEVVLLGQDRNEILFASGNNLITHLPDDGNNRVLGSFPEQILDAVITNQNIHILCIGGLYATNRDGRMEKLVGLNKAHGLMSLGNSQMAIATDAGLFLFNTASRKLSTVVRGVEFNRRGLYLEGNRLYAGSINGLYVFDAKNLESLAERTAKSVKSNPLPPYVVPAIATLALTTAFLSFLLYRSMSRLKQVIEESHVAETPKFGREDIEAFIQENLAMASLKSIADRFQTNNSHIYTLLAPEKPGAFINRLRMEQVIRMRKENRSAREISEQTGFSESYVRKVWNQQG
jgi:hypothetical protein